jgi:hypothetical protein
MAQTLPAVDVVRCYFDDSFDPLLPAMALRWAIGPGGSADRLWHLPEDVSLFGPPPRHFGVSVRRTGADAYAVRLLWERTSLAWKVLSRVQLLTSALRPILAALGTDLRELLEQPVQSARPFARAAA